MSYNAKILKYASNRSNFGEIADSKETGVGYVGNAACGDMLKVYLKVNDHGIIEDVKVKTYGCGCAIASTALAAEKLIGATLDDALKLKDKDLAEELSLPGIKKHCSVLAEAAVKSAIENYKKKQAGEYEVEMTKTIFEDVSKNQTPQSSCCSAQENAKSSCCKEEQAASASSSCCSAQENAKSSCCKEEQAASASSSCCGGSNKTQMDKEPISIKSIVNELDVTDAAKARFKEVLANYEGGIGIIVKSEAGGCAGNSYNLDIAYTQPEDCKKFTVDNLVLFVPKASLMFVLGTTIDYETTETQSGFKFINPNFKMCGCGESFKG